MIEAILRLRAPNNWFEWDGNQHELPATDYGLTSLVSTINTAITATGASLTLTAGTITDTVTVEPPDGDPWTLDAGAGVLAMLGLENKTTGTGDTVGEPCRGRFKRATLRRRFGMMPKHTSQHNHRATGTVAWGTQRPEDSLILDFPEADTGLWCRFADQVAAGLLVAESTNYFLLDDAVTPERRDGVIRVELAVVEA